ncbi:MAG: AraC family transcriptional regulator [Oceanospirillales bacterium]|nr:AraC family transcriptional regulator [Oceanospirillales bacterium]
MSENGQVNRLERQVPQLEKLPRPLFARNESLPNAVGTPKHSHSWVQLSYAVRGVLHVRTAQGGFVAPPQRAVWIPAGLEHEVFSSPRTEMRSLYIDESADNSGYKSCRVIEIDALLRELIRRFCEMPPNYDEKGPDGRLANVMLDQLLVAREVSLSLPLPSDPRLTRLCSGLQERPDDSRTLMQWGQELGASEKTLRRLFLRETGLTFRAWRQRLRLLGSLEALEQGQRVTEVALSCGYESTSAFIATFRQHFGVTPGDFFRH